MTRGLVSYIILAIIPFKVFSQQDTAENATLAYGAFMESYFAYSANQPNPGNIDYAVNYSRHNEVNVNLALFSAKYLSRKLRGNFGLQAGTYPLVNYATEPAALRHIYDANLAIRLYRHIWFCGGIFGSSHIGFETAVGKDNWTLTRSLSADNTPYYLAGAKLNYEPSEKMLASVIIANGWQNIRENNSSKSVGYQVAWKPDPKLNLSVSAFFSEAYNAPDSAARFRYFNQAYVIWQPGKCMGFALSADIGIQQTQKNGAFDALWLNPTLLVRSLLHKKWALCLRSEYYWDARRVIFTAAPAGVPFSTAGTSLNIDFMGVPNLLLRGEIKYFSAANPAYTTRTGLSNSDTIFTVSTAFWF